MKLIFIRHGETGHNKRDIIQGQYNSRLTKKGIRQAKLLAKRLSRERFDVIFCSDLTRARQTLREIIKFHKKLPVYYNKLLRERSFGILENISVKKYREYRKKKGVAKHLFKPRRGENYYDILKRVKKFYKIIYPKYKDKTVLLVSHGGFNRVLLGLLTKKPMKEAIEITQDNTCVNIAEIKRGKAKVHRLNCTRHL